MFFVAAQDRHRGAQARELEAERLAETRAASGDGDHLTREGARRLGLVTLEQMLKALAGAVDRPPVGIEVMDVSAIRAAI